MSKRVRIGLIGAGQNTCEKHIPGFQAIDGVEIVAVANRNVESANAVAAQYNIPKVYETWQQLLADNDIDAVVIGTLPNLHCEITCAALEAGKHVLVGSVMARNLAEARQMKQAAKKHPKLIARIVPSPFGLISGPSVEHMLKGHFIGDLREIVVLGVTSDFWDYSTPKVWRQDAEIVGNDLLHLGFLQETLQRWAPNPVQVFAQTELFEPTRPVPEESRFAEVNVPDSVQILAELQGGTRAIYHLSGIALYGPGTQIHFYGSRGTVKIQFRDGDERLFAARSGDEELKELQIPDEDRQGWRVEQDFIDSIHGEKKVGLPDFSAGTKVMEFLEAVKLSATENEPVSLPLE